MAQLSEAIARYHKLLVSNIYSDLSWAEEFQEQMRQLGLLDSGRLISPVLRPQLISRRQFEMLSEASERLSAILDRVEALALASPGLLNRLQMLPAEKMLAALPSGYSRFQVTSRFEANLENGSLYLRGLDTVMPKGIAHADILADLFLDLPVVKRFKRGRYKLSKTGGGVKHLHSAVLQAWKEFGGRHRPNIAILEFGDQSGSASNEGRLLAEGFTENGSPARVVVPDDLEYTHGKLLARDFSIDLVFRRVLTRDLLTHFDLSHPLLVAYREHTICVVNNFRSELAHRRALFDLVTDDAVMAHFSLPDRKLIRGLVPWTRVVAQKKTTYKGREVDLPRFILDSREELILRPNEDSDGQRVFVGAEMTQAAWEHALRVALRSPYVVQECLWSERQQFPVYLYGELQMKEASVSVHPYVFNGRMHGACATLETSCAGCSTPLAVVPVLVLEKK